VGGAGAILTLIGRRFGLKGIIIATGHKDFCVGADLEFVYRARDPKQVYEAVQGLDALLRKLETCGKPVVAALTGSALGGGYELALACDHILLVDDGTAAVSLPEVPLLAVLPGTGEGPATAAAVGSPIVVV
jgi:3-hydroxyacyl-CoA dehydrogenase/enoyl-CoA hydratase/3-hydroxybutyryl-CoA epimerase